MSHADRSENPWQPPSPPSGMSPVTPSELSVPTPRVRPGGLTAICVMGIVLGGLGLLTSCTGLMGQLFASQMQRVAAGMQPNQAAAGIQEEMNAKMMAIANRFKWLTLPLMALKLIVEAALLAGAIMSLGLRPAGRTCFLFALAAAAVVETIQAVPTVITQYESAGVMREMMPKLMQQAQQGPNNSPPGFDQMMTGIFSAVGIVTVVMALVWLAAKLAYYVIGFCYLKKPQVVALFTAPAAADVAAR